MTVIDAAPAGRLTVRKPTLDFAGSPKYWVYGDPQTTHLLNILHFGIPAGERYFMDGVRLALPYITDKGLQADARSFIGQESVHARMHEKAADHLKLFDIRAIRTGVAVADRRRERLYKRVDSLPEPLRRRISLVWLSGVMLGEHLTALLADQVFDDARVDLGAVDPEMANLLRWHAAEELEHRSVPYDIFEHVGGDYVTRVLPLLPGVAVLPLGIIGMSVLMLLDPDYRRPFSIVRQVRAARAKRAPSVLRVLGQMPNYLRPGHHPSHIGNDERARAWLASNPPSLAATAAAKKRRAAVSN